MYFAWLPQDPLLLQIIYKRYVKYDQPIDVQNLKTFMHQDLEFFYKIVSNNEFGNYFEFLNDSCVTTAEWHTFCLNTPNVEKLTHASSDKILQTLNFGEKYVALVTDSSVLIYDIHSKPVRILQKLATAKPRQIAYGSYKNYKFLAVLIERQSNTLNSGFVEIYRSINSSDFTLFQSLQCSNPMQIQFSFIERSNDFLMHVLTGSSVKPYLIYQYRGIMGFKEILADSILSEIYVDVTTFNLHSNRKTLVALSSEDKITIIELAITKYN